MTYRDQNYEHQCMALRAENKDLKNQVQELEGFIQKMKTKIPAGVWFSIAYTVFAVIAANVLAFALGWGSGWAVPAETVDVLLGGGGLIGSVIRVVYYLDT